MEELSRELRREAEQFLKDIMNGGACFSHLRKICQGRYPGGMVKAIPDFFEQQQTALNERVKVRLLECLMPHDKRISHLVETLRHTAADLFRVPYKPLLHEEALEIERRPYWVLKTWNTDALPMLQSLGQRLDGLVRRNVENIRWSMLQNLNVSFAGFARRVGNAWMKPCCDQGGYEFGPYKARGPRWKHRSRSKPHGRWHGGIGSSQSRAGRFAAQLITGE